MFPTNTSAALLLLAKKAFQIMLQEFTTGDFCPPLLKGDGGALRPRLSKKIPPSLFAKGGNFYIT
jgi:hypothetical protein